MTKKQRPIKTGKQETGKATSADKAVPDTPATNSANDDITDEENELKREEDDEVKIVMGTEADVTDEDLALLGDPDQDMDEGDDELIRKEGLDDTDDDGDLLNEAATDIDTDGNDLDIPAPEKKTAEDDDEENDYYSLGGDKDALEEDKS